MSLPESGIRFPAAFKPVREIFELSEINRTTREMDDLGIGKNVRDSHLSLGHHGASLLKHPIHKSSDSCSSGELYLGDKVFGEALEDGES